jgi:hypothetical protein
MSSKVYLLVTVDGDLRIGSLQQRESAVKKMREIHESLGFFGSTTWMINENDFYWTKYHGELLLELLQSGECVGVHDHLDTHHAESYDDVFNLMSRSRHQIEKFLVTNGIDHQLVAHRNGCAFQSEPSYRAAKTLGYSILSDVWPGMMWGGRMVCDGSAPNPWRLLDENDPQSIMMDNRVVPLRAIPWRHESDNWLDYESNEGFFLQVPINSMPAVDKKRVEIAIEHSDQAAFVVLDTHPYDLQSPKTGEISEDLSIEYYEALLWIKNTYECKNIRIDEVPDHWSGSAWV